MAQINKDLETLKTARDNMKTALEEKGQIVTKDIRTYAGAISNITSGDVKLFETIEEMQQDPNAKEEDKAVVYNKEIKTLTNDLIFRYVEFPDIVKFDNPITTSKGYKFKYPGSSDYDANAYIGEDYFNFRVTYRNSDSYTDIDVSYNFNTEKEQYEFGGIHINEVLQENTNLAYYEVDLQFDDSENPIDELIQSFIKPVDYFYGGFYVCNNMIDATRMYFPSLESLTFSNEDTTNNTVDLKFISTPYKNLYYDYNKVKSALATIRTQIQTTYPNWQVTGWIYLDSNDKINLITGHHKIGEHTMYWCDSFGYDFPIYYDNEYKISYFRNGWVASDWQDTYYIWELDIENQTCTLSKTGNMRNNCELPISEIDIKTLPIRIYNDQMVCYPAIKLLNNYTINFDETSDGRWDANGNIEYVVMPRINYYLPCPTQIYAKPENVTNISFIGKNGADIGILGTTLTNRFDDVTTKFYCDIQSQWDEMEVINITDDNKTIYCGTALNNSYLVPSKSSGECLYNFSTLNNFSNLFYACYNLRQTPDLFSYMNNATNTSRMFAWCENLQYIRGSLNTDNVTDMSYMFCSCRNLKKLPEMNYSKCSNMYAFANGGTYNIVTIDLKDTSNLINAYNCFQDCIKLTSINGFNTTKVNYASSTFRGCHNLTSFTNSILNFHNCRAMDQMFYDCQNLTTDFNLDLYNCTTISTMFRNCQNITNISMSNCSKLIDVRAAFYNCFNLTNNSLDNIMGALISATNISASNRKLGTNGGLGFSNDQINICKSLSNYNELVAAGWSE